MKKYWLDEIWMDSRSNDVYVMGEDISYILCYRNYTIYDVKILDQYM